MCTNCGALRCSKCKKRPCCQTPARVPAGHTVVAGLGNTLLACPRGCVGGKRHTATACKRPKNPNAQRVKHSRTWVAIRPGKRIRIEEAARRTAELWEIKTHPEHNAVGDEWVVLAGPAIPGATIPIKIANGCKRASVKAIHNVPVVPYASGWVPKDPFAGYSQKEWKSLAKSPCAWKRIVGGCMPIVPHGKAVEHKRLATPQGKAPLAHNPPLHLPHPRIKTAITCTYCNTTHKSINEYADACAPDARSYK